MKTFLAELPAFIALTLFLAMLAIWAGLLSGAFK